MTHVFRSHVDVSVQIEECIAPARKMAYYKTIVRFVY